VKRWIAFLDDSHSGGRLSDENFDPIPTARDGFTPMTGTGGFVLPGRNEASLRRDLEKLRRRIQKHLALSDPPIIHMRQLWGKRPPRDKGKNPFVGIDPETRFRWCREALELIDGYMRDGQMRLIGARLVIPDQQHENLEIHTTARARAEQRVLYAHYGSTLRKFYDILLNPLPSMIGAELFRLSRFARQQGATIEFTYDQSSASKGFSLLESFAVARSAGLIDRVHAVREEGCRTEPLLQLADVIAYCLQRMRTARYFREHDHGLERLLWGLALETIPDTHQEPISRVQSLSASSMCHYDYALQVLKNTDPAWAAEHLVSPAEMLQHMLAGGYPIRMLRDETLIAHGYDPQALTKQDPIQTNDKRPADRWPPV